MALVSGIEAIAQPQGAPSRDQRDANQRSPAEFGAAVTHRDAVRERNRVDPGSTSDKKRASDRFAREQQDYLRGKRKGLIVDVEV
jgi:hypothetical protein